MSLPEPHSPTDAPATGPGGAGPLKVALVTDCYLPQVGGIEMQVHDLARELRRAGHDPVVLTTTPGPDEVDGVRVRRMDVHRLPFGIPFTPGTFRVLTELLDEEAVDVAHFHGGIVSPLAFVGAGQAAAAGLPTVITIHCLWSYATPFFWALDRGYHWTEWPVVFSAVSDVAAAPIHSITRRPVEVAMLPNGIDPHAWRTVPAPRDASVVTFVSVMRLAPRKRPGHLIRLFARVVEQAPPGVTPRLVIVGDGPERPKLQALITRLGLDDHVELAGRKPRDEISAVFAHADVFVAPANLESFGIAALEARCAGLPVVAKARTGIREFVAHGQEGLLAASDADLANQMVRLARDAKLREQLAAHNRCTAPPLDWPTVLQLNLDAYARAAELAEGSAARRRPDAAAG